MNHEQARIEAILDHIAETATTFDDSSIEAVVPIDTLTELDGLGYDLRALTDDVSSRISR